MEDLKNDLLESTTIFHKFRMGAIVYFITDTDQKPYIITGFLHSMAGSLQYRVEQGSSNSTWAYEDTISEDKDVALKTGN